MLYPVACLTLHGIAFLYYWPTLLALVSQAAPTRLKSTLMGVAFLSLFIGNVTLGWLGAWYERVGPTAFWALHAGIAAIGVFLALAFGPKLTRTLGIVRA